MATIDSLQDAVADLQNFFFQNMAFKQTLLTGTVDPLTTGVIAPIKTNYDRLDGSGNVIGSFKKIGSGNTDWQAIGSGGGGGPDNNRVHKNYVSVAQGTPTPGEYDYVVQNYDAIILNDLSSLSLTAGTITVPDATSAFVFWLYVYPESNLDVDKDITLQFNAADILAGTDDDFLILDEIGLVVRVEYDPTNEIWLTSRESDLGYYEAPAV